ncbi:tyrosine-type recombinase/integrase [Spiribacter halobius]|uniref:tyrosine-type recombinase/integrase n=1 Tax=Sediminicurvatus halobius TaxID=2182432 RepID=UPI001E51BD66|nr:tyrosine-type recombinase/integrase [Spiribacter halobius]UEX77722.1 tyrosine-type recombinase/integrase [Spiribacter halobius]
MDHSSCQATRLPCNKGRICGQKRPVKREHIWVIRIRLELAGRLRDLALFSLGRDSELRSCDLVRLRVRDVMHVGHVLPRAMLIQSKTRRPVQFELTEATRTAVAMWVGTTALAPSGHLFPSRLSDPPHLSTRQYAPLLKGWLHQIALDAAEYGTHSIRRTKATMIYRQTRNPRAVPLLLGDTRLESTSGTSASRLLTPCVWPNRPTSE